MVFTMKFSFLIALFLVSCGSAPVSQPFRAPGLREQITAPVILAPDLESSVKTKAPASKKKILAGTVTFAGLTVAELADFRVIPESGKGLITPENKSYDEVDGLWWKGAKVGTWFKIPGSSEAWVGDRPEGFDGIAEHRDLGIYYRSNALVKLVGFVKKGVNHPNWVQNEGRTLSPIESPWFGN